MPMNLALAETIRELRRRKGVSQEKLADAIDSHQVYISEIENGRKLPSLTVLLRMASFFGLRLSELVALVEERLS